MEAGETIQVKYNTVHASDLCLLDITLSFRPLSGFNATISCCYSSAGTKKYLTRCIGDLLLLGCSEARSAGGDRDGNGVDNTHHGGGGIWLMVQICPHWQRGG